ncbi:DUF2238 domain-containing protein [Paenibacillus sp. MBLB4367]|uniref:DUF2238 domain-containing protein n=1 Tax=Paenibacillus sp. MBLB4367 TaxID=3384767 RepID=UPI00390830B9
MAKDRSYDRLVHGLMLISFLGAAVWSGVHPVYWGTWFAEVGPAIVGAAILVWSYRHFRFSSPVYQMIFVSGIIMAIGGHYSYEHVPLFDTLKETFHWSRNHFDRLGHLIQGAVPAFIARELLVRYGIVSDRKWLFVIVWSVALSVSAIYEIMEFAAAASMGKSPDEVLGAQGDIWDSEWDMLCAFIGALAALILFSSYHDRNMEKHRTLPS